MDLITSPTANKDNERRRRRYNYLRARNRCVKCAKRDERTLDGKSECVECAAKALAYYYRKRGPSPDRSKRHLMPQQTPGG